MNETWFERQHQEDKLSTEECRYYASLRSCADVWVIDMKKGTECNDDNNSDWKHFLFDVRRRVEPLHPSGDVVHDLRHEIHEVMNEQPHE